MQANSDLTDIEFIVNEIYCSVSDSGAGWDGKVERGSVKDSPDK